MSSTGGSKPTSGRGSGTSPVRMGVMVMVALLAAAHLRVESVGLSYSGWLIVADHLYNLTLAAGLMALCAGVGERILHARRPAELTEIDLVLFSVLTGAGVVAVGFLVLGTVGLLSPWAVGGLVASLAWLARDEIASIPSTCRQALGSLSGPVLGVLAVVAIVLLSRSVLPPTDWDSLMYHLEIPAQFLERGRLFVPADNLHVAFVGLVQMLYLPLLTFGGPTAAAMFSLGFGLLLPLLAFRFAQHLFGGGTAELAAIAVWGTPTLALVALTPRVDVTLAVFLVAGHYAICRAWNREGGRWLALAGLMLGFAVGVKYQAVPYLAGLVPVVAWGILSDEAEGFDLRTLGAATGLGLVALSPWLAKNWVLLEAPLYPFFAERLLPPWMTALYGTATVPASVAEGAFQILWEARESFNLWDAFVNPGHLSPEAEAVHYHLTPLLALLPAWLLWWRDQRLAWLIVPGLLCAGLIVGWSPRTNLRYFVPAVVPLVVAVTAMVVRGIRAVDAKLGERGSVRSGEERARSRLPKRTLRVGVLAVAIAALVPTGLALGDWLPGSVSLSQLSGSESRLSYLNRMGVPGNVLRAGLPDRGGNTRGSVDARVLMLFDARGYYSPVSVIQDNNATTWRLLVEAPGELSCLRETGVTHVLLGAGTLRYYFERGLEPERIRWDDFGQFRSRCLNEVFSVGGHVLYRIRGSGGT